jgi:hypothetical protein
MTNRHPVDRLAEIRAEIAVLKEEEADLRARIINGEVVPLRGEEWVAVVRARDRRVITVADAERVLPPEQFKRIVRHERIVAVILHELPDEPGSSDE